MSQSSGRNTSHRFINGAIALRRPLRGALQHRRAESGSERACGGVEANNDAMASVACGGARRLCRWRTFASTHAKFARAWLVTVKVFCPRFAFPAANNTGTGIIEILLAPRLNRRRGTNLEAIWFQQQLFRHAPGLAVATTHRVLLASSRIA